MIPALAAGYVSCIKLAPSPSRLLPPGFEPSETSIAKVLYTFCKVRGRKVIVTLFPSESIHQFLQPLIEYVLRRLIISHVGVRVAFTTWQESYVAILWLWYLMTVSFDLTVVVDDASLQSLSMLRAPALPTGVPKVAEVLVRISVVFLYDSGKPGEAAALLLARLASRSDMQTLNLGGVLINWSVDYLRDLRQTSASWLYGVIGHLSFLKRMIATMGASTPWSGLAAVWNFLSNVYEGHHATAQSIRTNSSIHLCILKLLTIFGIRQMTSSLSDGPTQNERRSVQRVSRMQTFSMTTENRSLRLFNDRIINPRRWLTRN